MRHVHTIPVDPSLSPEEAWGELCNFGRRVTYSGLQDPVTDAFETWAAMDCDGDGCRNIDRSNCRRFYNEQDSVPSTSGTVNANDLAALLEAVERVREWASRRNHPAPNRTKGDYLAAQLEVAALLPQEPPQ